MKRPTPEQVEIAAMWLEGNEGDGAEGEACRAVAAWLIHESNRREFDAAIRHHARKAGVRPSALRARLKQ